MPHTLDTDPRTEIARSLRVTETDVVRGTACAELCLEAALPIFRGHFPGHPIVPGVYLIEAARKLAEHAEGRKLATATVVEARFTQVVAPDRWARLVATREGESAPECAVRVVVEVDGATAARIRLRLA